MEFKKILFVITLLVTSTFSISYAQDFINLDALIKEALKNNPKVKAYEAAWAAEREKTKQVTTLPDPVFTYGFFGKNIETKTGPQKEKFSIAQKIPFPGKLSLKGKIQEKQAQQTRQMYEAEKRELIKNVKVVFYDLYWVDRAIEITQEEKDILTNSAKIVQRKYEANLKPQSDVLKIELEISKLIDKLLLLRQRRRALAAKMNSLLDRPVDSSLAKIKEINLREIALDSEALKQITFANRQEINILRAGVDKAKFGKTLAKFDFLPDFTLGFNYINVEGGHTTQADDGEDAWLATLSVNLPIWQTKLNAGLKEKHAKLTTAIKNLENKQNEVEYELNDLYFKLLTYNDIVSLYETALIPQANQAYQTTRTAYESGKTDFLNWLDSERMLLKVKLVYYKSRADYAKTVALLERAVGKGF